MKKIIRDILDVYRRASANRKLLASARVLRKNEYRGETEEYVREILLARGSINL